MSFLLIQFLCMYSFVQVVYSTLKYLTYYKRLLQQKQYNQLAARQELGSTLGHQSQT